MSSPQALANILATASLAEYTRFVAHWMTNVTDLDDAAGLTVRRSSMPSSPRRATRDIDAVFEPKSEIYAAASRVAARRGLPDGWLNDAVKGSLPGPDADQRAILTAPGINVSVPPPEYLLALKVYAARVDRDADDIKELADLCGAKSAEDVLVIAERVMGGRGRLMPKAQYLIEELFAQPDRRRPGSSSTRGADRRG